MSKFSDLDPLFGNMGWQQPAEVRMLEDQLKTAKQINLEEFQYEVLKNIKVLESIADECLDNYHELLDIVLSEPPILSSEEVGTASLQNYHSNYSRYENEKEHEQKVRETEELIAKNLDRETISLFSNLKNTASQTRIQDERGRIAKLLAPGVYDSEKLVKTPTFWKSIRDAFCPSLQLISDDTFEVTKLIVSVLVPLSLAGTITVPLQPIFYAWIVLMMTRVGVKNICDEYISQNKFAVQKSAKIMTEKESSRVIHVSGNYIESNNGSYVQGDYINMSQDLTHAAIQIQELLFRLQKQGSTASAAQQQVAEDLVTQSKSNPTVMGKLVKWGQSLADTASKTSVNEAAKIVVLTALRLAGLPLQ